MLPIFSRTARQCNHVSKLETSLGPSGSQHLAGRKDFGMPTFDIAIINCYEHREDRMGILPLVVNHGSHQRNTLALISLYRGVILAPG